MHQRASTSTQKYSSGSDITPCGASSSLSVARQRDELPEDNTFGSWSTNATGTNATGTNATGTNATGTNVTGPNGAQPFQFRGPDVAQQPDDSAYESWGTNVAQYPDDSAFREIQGNPEVPGSCFRCCEGCLIRANHTSGRQFKNPRSPRISNGCDHAAIADTVNGGATWRRCGNDTDGPLEA